MNFNSQDPTEDIEMRKDSRHLMTTSWLTSSIVRRCRCYISEDVLASVQDDSIKTLASSLRVEKEICHLSVQSFFTSQRFVVNNRFKDVKNVFSICIFKRHVKFYISITVDNFKVNC